MKLIAKKPCSFGGKKFYGGDDIPAELVLNPQVQEKRGVLAIVADDAAPASDPTPDVVLKEVDAMTVVIRAKEGDLPLNLTQEGLQSVVDVLTVKPAEAVSIIEKMEDGDALILVHIMDVRKAVKEAAEERAKALNAGDDDDDEAQTVNTGDENEDGAQAQTINTEESAGDQ